MYSDSTLEVEPSEIVVSVGRWDGATVTMQSFDAGRGKVVVNRAMSLDGFIAAAGHRMDWGGGRPLADFAAPEDFAEIAAATGAMLIGRRTWDVGSEMQAEQPESYDYPFPGRSSCSPTARRSPRRPASPSSAATSIRRSRRR